MTEHSLLGASSAYRWLNCPGSFRLSQTAPHRPSSIYAATGTLAHEYIETAVKSGTFQCDDTSQSLLREGHVITVDQDFVTGVNVMLDYLQGIAALSDWTDIEFRVDLAGYFPASPPVPVFGTVDAAVHTMFTETLEVVDYKNGAGITVSAIENPQLIFYGAGVLAHLPAAQRDRVRTVKLTIVQPHAQGVSPIRSWEIDVVDLLMWVDEVLVPGVEACAAPDAPLVPGSWCRFCPVSHACPKLMADALEMAKREFDDESVPQDLPKGPDELAKALDTAERAELWIARIREFAIDQLQHQVRIPGWGLVPTKATRKWLAPDTDIAHRLSDLGASHDEIWETRVRSPAQIERQLHRTRKGRLIWDQAATMVEARSSGLKLGRDNHADAREDFSDE
jgi:Protein of unknown function (DUF2800)